MGARFHGARMSEQCVHEWIANSGLGGAPQFTIQSIVAGETPVMHVKCSKCGCRTWFSEAKWRALPREGETRQQRRQRLREAAVIERRKQERQAQVLKSRRREFDKTGRTYWNGEPAKCRRVVVRVGAVLVPTWWCARLEGQERNAVEVTYYGQTFFLDNEDGSGWAKVTVGRGSPGWRHSSLPDDSVVLREATA